MIGLGAYFVHIGLDRSNTISGVLGLFVSIIGLAVSIISAVQGRSAMQSASAQRHVRMSQQSGGNSTNIQAGGDMHIGDNNKLGGS
jgi:hypothetical protein